MTNDELAVQLKDLKQELFNLRFQNATGQLGNVMVIQKTKKDIARVKTILRERELKSAMES
jgi:large subunit ribosomal protein L29